MPISRFLAVPLLAIGAACTPAVTHSPTASDDWRLPHLVKNETQMPQERERIKTDQAKCEAQADARVASASEATIQKNMKFHHANRQETLRLMRQTQIEGCQEMATWAPDVRARAERSASQALEAVRTGQPVPDTYPICTTANLGAYAPHWVTTCR